MRVLFVLTLGLFACGSGGPINPPPTADAPPTTITAGCFTVAEGLCCSSPGDVEICQYHLRDSTGYDTCQDGTITCLPSGAWGACEATVNLPDAVSAVDATVDSTDTTDTADATETTSGDQ